MHIKVNQRADLDIKIGLHGEIFIALIKYFGNYFTLRQSDLVARATPSDRHACKQDSIFHFHFSIILETVII